MDELSSVYETWLGNPGNPQPWRFRLLGHSSGVRQCHKPPIWAWFIHVYTTYFMVIKGGWPMTWPAGTLVVCRSGTSKDSPRSGGPQYSPLVPLGMSTGVTIESGIVTIRTERIQSLVSADIITSLYILNLYLHVFASSDSICFCLCKDATWKHHQSRMQQTYSGVKMKMRRSVVESKWRLFTRIYLAWDNDRNFTSAIFSKS